MTRPSTHLVELPGFRLGVRSGPAARRGRTGRAAAGVRRVPSGNCRAS